jgi:hypothetical protein
MTPQDINALTELTNLHIRLSDAFQQTENLQQKRAVLAIQAKVAEEMGNIVNPLQDAKCVGGLPTLDPKNITVTRFPIEQEDKPTRRRTRGLGIR